MGHFFPFCKKNRTADKDYSRLCPMLNGTMKQEDMAVTGFGGGPGPGAAGAGPGGESSSFGALPV
jgi:hypothetical protein